MFALVGKLWPVALLLLSALVVPSVGRTGDWKDRVNQSGHVNQCMAKIVEVVQPCSERAISNWSLNHSLFVPSRLSTCCANWEVYDCFIQASLENCNLLEFQALVLNMTADALALQRTNCSRFKYHSETCAMNSGTAKWTVQPVLGMVIAGFVLVAIWEE